MQRLDADPPKGRSLGRLHDRPVRADVDWELNHQYRRHDLAVYWLEPPLVSQGSETGIYQSSQR